ncbi:MAG: hypothetical protein CBC29_09075 [Methylococcaceae bacterium TMED69]|nr:MAG: hypothetical protein CBC29_09075 [Methylococcaceae bacterium TMED69]|tara:strand:- start:686 stop:934 length:249 start_codon:yes stop_codon:yes gene_type:complete
MRNLPNLFIFVLFNWLSLSIYADSYVIENHKLQVEKKKFGKEIINVQTVCIDGYKFIITSNSIEQFYEESDGLPMPAPCYSR